MAMADPNAARPGPTERLQNLMLNDRGFVFDPLNGETFQCNATGLACLRALQAGKAADELVATLVDGWEVDATTACFDLDAFVADLRALGWYWESTDLKP